MLATPRIAFPESVRLTIRGSGKAADKDKRPEMVFAMGEIDGDDVKGGRAGNGHSPFFCAQQGQ
jgi:hypothetical protein